MFSPFHLFEIFMKMFYNLMTMLLVYMLILSKLATKPRKSYGIKTLFTLCLLITFSEKMNIAQYCFRYFFYYNGITLFSYSSLIRQGFVVPYTFWLTVKMIHFRLQKFHLLNTYCIHCICLSFQVTELDGKCGYIPFICKSVAVISFFIYFRFFPWNQYRTLLLAK